MSEQKFSLDVILSFVSGEGTALLTGYKTQKPFALTDPDTLGRLGFLEAASGLCLINTAGDFNRALYTQLCEKKLARKNYDAAPSMTLCEEALFKARPEFGTLNENYSARKKRTLFAEVFAGDSLAQAPAFSEESWAAGVRDALAFKYPDGFAAPKIDIANSYNAGMSGCCLLPLARRLELARARSAQP